MRPDGPKHIRELMPEFTRDLFGLISEHEREFLRKRELIETVFLPRIDLYSEEDQRLIRAWERKYCRRDAA